MNQNALEYFQSKRSRNPATSLQQKDWSAMRLMCESSTASLSSLQLRIKIKEKAHQKDYQGAISLLNQLINRQPDSAIDYNNRGLMFLKMGQYGAAMADFNEAIALNPRLDRAYNNRANCYAIQGNLIKAINDYEAALDINPYNQRVWINQGITLRELNEYELAIETLEIALIMGEQYQGRIYAERGYTYYVRGDWNCAIADYYRALSHLPKSDRYYQKVEKWLEKVLQPLKS
ncbi:tetratricopeptide repeat protein [Crocosphaera sp. UHCC 0190]|uniref:tetratricopeptide repeat protein n=1 Tax=Crocosphaera sp. UHCC 0190 TaxID=3110246 RepID=UPI002B2210B6|nr:tetratricopeptide repeat protein [Crocosphaera sp. UHCC 0190]MEA5510365.1 tetratricopeptide repeat protein [Crocosphaera sp. UHCC 0190]